MSFNYTDWAEDKGVLPSLAKKKKTGEGDALVLEAAGGGSSMDFADAQLRSMAMGVVLTWIEDGDFSFNAIDELIMGVADLDGDDELSDDEVSVYEDLWSPTADAMLSLGADPDNVGEFLDGESDAAGKKLGDFLSSAMNDTPASDDEIVTSFATGDDGSILECSAMEDNDDAVLEAAFKKVKVVRGGKVVIKKKRVSGKVRMSAAQKAGLKKARRKANTSAAKMKRRKAMKVRKSRGM